jgi:hypothetical protein
MLWEVGKARAFTSVSVLGGHLILGLVDTLHGRGMSIAVRDPGSVECQEFLSHNQTRTGLPAAISRPLSDS